MPRGHRIWVPGMTYHVTSRGNKQAQIFIDRRDFQKYLTYLAEAKELYPFKLHAYCLMSNHSHLLIEMQKDPITDIMKFTQTRYAIYFNHRYDLSGHVFQGRFKGALIKDAEHFLNASRYIHANPVEAAIVTKPNEYPWSSYSSYFSSEPNPIVETERILSFFPEPKHEHYLQFMQSPKKESEHYVSHY
ncbi:REP-associated tyrosine transposase [Pseudoneobacillus sp. C159]